MFETVKSNLKLSLQLSIIERKDFTDTDSEIADFRSKYQLTVTSQKKVKHCSNSYSAITNASNELPVMGSDQVGLANPFVGICLGRKSFSLSTVHCLKLIVYFLLP